MLLQYLEQLSAVSIPQTRRLIFTATDNHVAIGAKGHRAYSIGVPLKDLETLTSAYIP
jgi:hypothetical protein